MPVTCCPVLELRQYTLHPETRETLVRVFEEHFIEGQEQHGMCIIGQFRDLAAPDRFVWIRGFSDMEARRQALEAFYTGPVWKEHGPVANATMIDHTNVLLLRPADTLAGFAFDPQVRPPLDGPDGCDSVIAVTTRHLGAAVSPTAGALLRDELSAALAEVGATLLALLVTEPATNTFPRLPVRDDNVLVWFASYPSEESYRQATARLISLPRWTARITPQLETISRGRPPELLLLQPTRRSSLRHRGGA